MNVFRNFLLSAAAITTLFISFAYQAGAAAPGPKVSEVSVNGNKHNLSARAWTGGSYTGTNPNTYRAIDDPTANPRGQQICIFCHTPHSANVEGGAPLWNRKFSKETFSRYSSGTLQIRVNSAARTPAGYDTPAWQPDGSSKLCLSCHDGSDNTTVDTTTHGLGTLLRGNPITMTADIITGVASFNPSTNKMKTGHHPISFKYDTNVAAAINAVKGASPDEYVMPDTAKAKLDKNSKMQCTTCHDAHQNQSDDDSCYGGACSATSRKTAPFWIYHGGGNTAAQDRDAVCTTCHALTLPNSPLTPYP